jgi:hypothetical protein
MNQRFRVFSRGIDSLTDLSWLTCPKMLLRLQQI